MISGTILAVLIAYLLVLLAIGLWGSRESQSIQGYYVADKKLPAWVIAFSSNATGESAWLLLGLTGMGYMVGVQALWVVLGEVLGVAMGWVLVALPFKRLTDRYQSITVADFAAQLTASGKAFSSFLGINYTTGVIIGTAIILFYTTVGGFKAVAYSDVVQGILMFAGLILLPTIAIVESGGWTSMLNKLVTIDPQLVEPMGRQGLSVDGVVAAISFLGIGLAFLGAPQLLVRFISARDEKEIVTASLLAVVCIVVFDLGAVLTGMAGRTLFPDLADPETIMPILSDQLFPPLITGIFFVIVLAAMMSTVDSLLILASSAVVRDVIQKTFRSTLSENRLSKVGKLVTVIIGGAALITAFAEVRLIFWFVLFAWSGLASAFAPPVLCSLFWKRTSREGALAGMAGGFLAAMAWVLFFKEAYYDLYTDKARMLADLTDPDGENGGQSTLSPLFLEWRLLGPARDVVLQIDLVRTGNSDLFRIVGLARGVDTHLGHHMRPSGWIVGGRIQR
jgi:SSS family transporter